MSSINKSTNGVDSRMNPSERLAGGLGMLAAKQTPIQTLKRLASTCLMWEKNAYIDGKTVHQLIQDTIPLCDAKEVAELAVRIRKEEGLRHVPLVMIRELFRNPKNRHIAGQYLPHVIMRPDEITEFVALYWKDGKIPLANQIKKGLSEAFNKFSAFSLTKYKDEDKDISLRDVLHLVHAKPGDAPKRSNTGPINSEFRKLEKRGLVKLEEKSRYEFIFEQLSNKTLNSIETRETLLSSSKTDEEKRLAYIKLIKEDKLGTTTLLMNLKAMSSLGVPSELIHSALLKTSTRFVQPLDLLKAKTHAPQFSSGIENLMYRCLAEYPKLTGHTVMLIDCSGSMDQAVSSKSEFSRKDIAYAMAIMAKEMCDNVTIYLTAGNYTDHITEEVKSGKGWALIDEMKKIEPRLNKGGIFTRQALEYVKKDLGDKSDTVDRIIVFSDSQDCDPVNKVPKPFGKYNYIADISSEKNGINFKGVWTQEISGWSINLLKYIAECEQGYQKSLF